MDAKDKTYLRNTEPFAARLHWWWRNEPVKVFAEQLTTDDAAFARNIFEGRFEQSARLWEIGRRLKKLRPARFNGIPFCALSLDEMEAAILKFPPLEPESEIIVIAPTHAAAFKDAKKDKRWSDPFVASFNLTLSSDRLLRHVSDFIEAERTRLNVKRTSRSNKGRRNREVSWRYVEMHDLKEHYAAHPDVRKFGLLDHSAAAKMVKIWEAAKKPTGGRR